MCAYVIDKLGTHAISYPGVTRIGTLLDDIETYDHA